MVREAPTGGDVVLRVRQDDEVYCTLTICDGKTSSKNIVNGLNLPPLTIGKRLCLDIVSVSAAFPGRDLTITIRM